MKKRIICVLIIILLIIGLFGAGYLCFFPLRSNKLNHMILSSLEKTFQKRLEFSDSSIWLPGNVFLENALVTDKKGRLYQSKTADIKYNIFDLLFGRRIFSFKLRGVKLYRDIGLIDSVSDMLIISKLPDIEFEGLEGAIELHKDAVNLRKIHVYSDIMRIRTDGWINYEGLLDCDITFSFNKAVTDMVPDVVKQAILKNEDEGWMGISLKATGNYKRPTLHLTGDTIRLNIIEGLFKDE